VLQLDITDDGFLSLKMPEGEVGEKIEKLYKTEEKDCSRSRV
jgi:hypothetical protein